MRGERCMVPVPSAPRPSSAPARDDGKLRTRPSGGVSRSPATPTLDDETERAAASPPPLWGRDRVGGIAEHLRWGFPPPLTPPHKGEGNPRTACLWLHHPTHVPSPIDEFRFRPCGSDTIGPNA